MSVAKQVLRATLFSPLAGFSCFNIAVDASDRVVPFNGSLLIYNVHKKESQFVILLFSLHALRAHERLDNVQEPVDLCQPVIEA